MLIMMRLIVFLRSREAGITRQRGREKATRTGLRLDFEQRFFSEALRDKTGGGLRLEAASSFDYGNTARTMWTATLDRTTRVECKLRYC